jgi:hypothetical protein
MEALNALKNPTISIAITNSIRFDTVKRNKDPK